MSLINDALKRARQAQPGGVQNPLPPLPPASGRPAAAGLWLLPAIVIFLVAAAIFLFGLAMAHRSAHKDLTALLNPVAAAAAAQPAVAVAQPAAAPSPAAPTLIKAPAAVTLPKPPPPNLPRLQGIFYSPSAPAAILDGKTVRPGDSFLQYRVTEITRSTVTLAGPGGRAVKLGLND
jgi:hypothetical protein